MSFDTGTWWLIATICVILTSALAYLIKRALFIKVDKIESRVELIEKTHVLKLDHDKDIKAKARAFRRDSKRHLNSI